MRTAPFSFWAFPFCTSWMTISHFWVTKEQYLGQQPSLLIKNHLATVFCMPGTGDFYAVTIFTTSCLSVNFIHMLGPWELVTVHTRAPPAPPALLASGVCTTGCQSLRSPAVVSGGRSARTGGTRWRGPSPRGAPPFVLFASEDWD